MRAILLTVLLIVVAVDSVSGDQCCHARCCCPFCRGNCQNPVPLNYDGKCSCLSKVCGNAVLTVPIPVVRQYSDPYQPYPIGPIPIDPVYPLPPAPPGPIYPSPPGCTTPTCPYYPPVNPYPPPYVPPPPPPSYPSYTPGSSPSYPPVSPYSPPVDPGTICRCEDLCWFCSPTDKCKEVCPKFGFLRSKWTLSLFIACCILALLILILLIGCLWWCCAWCCHRRDMKNTTIQISEGDPRRPSSCFRSPSPCNRRPYGGMRY